MLWWCALPAPSARAIVYIEANFISPPPSSSLLLCLHPPLYHSSLSVHPSLPPSPHAPWFPPMSSLLFALTFLPLFSFFLRLPVCLPLFTLRCARQPVRVFYCSSSFSPSSRRPAPWCRQRRAVLAYEDPKLPCCSTRSRQPPSSLPTPSPNSPGGTLTSPRYNKLWSNEFETSAANLLLGYCYGPQNIKDPVCNI